MASLTVPGYLKLHRITLISLVSRKERQNGRYSALQGLDLMEFQFQMPPASWGIYWSDLLFFECFQGHCVRWARPSVVIWILTGILNFTDRVDTHTILYSSSSNLRKRITLWTSNKVFFFFDFGHWSCVVNRIHWDGWHVSRAREVRRSAAD